LKKGKINFEKLGNMKKIVFENGEIELDKQCNYALVISLPNSYMENGDIANNTIEIVLSNPNAIVPFNKAVFMLEQSIKMFKKDEKVSASSSSFFRDCVANSPTLVDFIRKSIELGKSPDTYAKENADELREICKGLGVDMTEEEFLKSIDQAAMRYHELKREETQNEEN